MSVLPPPPESFAMPVSAEMQAMMQSLAPELPPVVSVQAWAHPDGRIRTSTADMEDPWVRISEEEMHVAIADATREIESTNTREAERLAKRSIVSRLAEVVGATEADLIEELRTALNE